MWCVSHAESRFRRSEEFVSTNHFPPLTSVYSRLSEYVKSFTLLNFSGTNPTDINKCLRDSGHEIREWYTLKYTHVEQRHTSVLYCT